MEANNLLTSEGPKVLGMQVWLRKGRGWEGERRERKRRRCMLGEGEGVH